MKKLILIMMLFVITLSTNAINYGQNKIQSHKIEWSRLETMHFDIYYVKGQDEFGQIAALMAEEAYFYLKQDFTHPIKYRIPIIFYSSQKEFSTTNIIYPLLSEGVGGFTEYMKNRVVVPFDGSFVKLEEVLIHELTHAYVNAVNSGSRSGNILSFALNSLPFWFSEGLPEFESIGGKDNYNNMFVIDLVLNDNLANLNEIGGYYAYRLGESFITYISEEYGRSKVMEYFYATRISQNMDVATEKVFGMSFKDIQLRWKNYLKRKYSTTITNYNIPYEVFERKTDHKKNESYMNYSAKFSPDGKSYVYYSNRGLRTGIWLGNTFSVVPDRRLLTGEKSPKFEEFHFRRNNLSWFPDSKRIAFVSKTTMNDNIYILDVITKKITEVISLPDFNAVYEIDVSHDGNKIVFSAQKNTSNDLYVYDLITKEIIQLTDDRYNDFQPRWSPDDNKIAFTSERSITDSIASEHIFYSLKNNIFYFDLDENKMFQVTDDDYHTHSPMWNGEGNKLFFISEKDYIANYEVIILEEGLRGRVTNTLCGILNGDIRSDEEYLLVSTFFDSGWDIYMKSTPMEDINYYNYHTPKEKTFRKDFYKHFEIGRYKYFGKKNGKMKHVNGKNHPNKKVTTIDLTDIAKRDSLIKNQNKKWDKKPSQVNIPKIYDYKPKFTIDSFWGGMAYSSSAGTVGQLQLSLSDLMGNHGIGIQLYVSDKIDQSDLIFSYLYLAKRIDYGIGLFNLSDETIWKLLYSDGSVEYQKEKEHSFGLYTLIRYPFNKFWRLDFENTLYGQRESIEDWDDVNDKWIDNYEDNFFVYSPKISLIHDNALWGYTGPISGWRSNILINKTFTKEGQDYLTCYADLRKYFMINSRYSFATRLVAGASIGDDPQTFGLDDFGGIRGFSSNIEGKKKIMTSLEFRYPLIDQLVMPFPVPLILTNIRGAVYADIGTVWNDNNNFRGMKSGQLEDIKMGFGFGPRFNLGYFIMRLEIAWTTDLVDHGKPTYYVFLAPDF